jgi:hypothetical protein
MCVCNIYIIIITIIIIIILKWKYTNVIQYTVDIKPKVSLNNIDKVNIFHLLILHFEFTGKSAVTRRILCVYNLLYTLLRARFKDIVIHRYDDYKYYTGILCVFLSELFERFDIKTSKHFRQRRRRCQDFIKQLEPFCSPACHLLFCSF